MGFLIRKIIFTTAKMFNSDMFNLSAWSMKYEVKPPSSGP